MADDTDDIRCKKCGMVSLGCDESYCPEAPSTGCGWTGRAFGANYPDGICIGGQLWDLDSCDEPGDGLMSGGDRSCPNCDPAGVVEDWAFSGSARQRRIARRSAARRVKMQAEAETDRWTR